MQANPTQPFAHVRQQHYRAIARLDRRALLLPSGPRLAAIMARRASHIATLDALRKMEDAARA